MQQSSSGSIPLRQFGRHPVKISALGLGGHHLGDAPDEKTAIQILGGSGEMVRHGTITAHEGLRYAMSLPVATTISGIDTMEVLDQNLQVAVNFQSLSAAEMQSLRDRTRYFASDGRFELFKMTTKYDGKVGRQQHHFPTEQELPL